MDVDTPHAKTEWVEDLILPKKKAEFERRRLALIDLAQDSGIGPILVDMDGEPVDPAFVKSEASEIQKLLPKVKTHLFEQQAKHAFTTFLIAEDAPDEEDMEALVAQVPPKKAALREAKAKLAATHATLVEQTRAAEDDYNHCLAQSARLAELEAKIVDTKVKLARLRQQHPPASRMTASRAEATAERQTNELVSLQEQIDAGHERAEEYAAQREKKKSDAATAAAKRAEVERELKARRRAIKEAGQAEDARIGELVEWNEATLQLHAALTSVTALDRSGTDISLSYRTRAGTDASVALRFDDAVNPRILSQADIRGLDGDLDGVIDAFVGRNDPRGLVRHVAHAATGDLTL